ncbi:MAG: hypothetical protein M3P51_15405 [Chloroflexota bacterium]|nr:hypothetical protein [Chloroflexota bacterium]
MREKLHSLLRNTAWGIAWGILFALAYSVLAIILFLTSTSRSHDPNGPVLLEVIAAYLFGGIVGGATVGLLRPVVRSRPGAAFVGLLVAIPVVLGIGVALYGFSGWNRHEVIGLTITAILLGPAGGVILWNIGERYKDL